MTKLEFLPEPYIFRIRRLSLIHVAYFALILVKLC
jgi:hypothetical protein